MIARVTAVAFDDHALVETARCRVDSCRRMLVFEAGSAPSPAARLGWMRVELSFGGGSGMAEWRCPEHGSDGRPVAGTLPGHDDDAGAGR